MDYKIKKELAKWDDRVLFDVKFKDGTKANLERLNLILSKSFEKFTVIAAISEAMVYKIGRHFIEKGAYNSEMTFIDGNLIESFIGDNSVEWKKKERVDELFSIFGEECRNKWVLIPLMQFELSIGLSIYFITNFKKIGAIGLIFFSEGPNNLAEILSMNYSDANFHQFPRRRYYIKTKILQDDEY